MRNRASKAFLGSPYLGLILFLGLISGAVSETASAKKKEDPFVAEAERIFAEAVKHDLARQFLSRVQTRDLRHGLDAAVDELMRTDPLARKLRGTVVQQHRRFLTALEHRSLLIDALVMPESREGGQYAELWGPIQDVAGLLYFPQQLIDDPRILVVHDPIANGWTWSPFPEETLLVTLTDSLVRELQEGMGSTDGTRVVLGHEFGHIKGEHVTTGILLVAVFFKKMQNLLDGLSTDEVTGEGEHEEGAPTGPISVRAARESLERTRDEAVSLFFNHARQPGVEPTAWQKAARPAFDRSLGETMSLMSASLDEEELDGLASALFARMGSNGSADELEEGEVPEVLEVGRKARSTEEVLRVMRQFYLLFLRWVRSAEQTADHFGLVAGPLDAALQSDTILAIGPGRNHAAFRSQIEIVAAAADADDELMLDLLRAQFTHPDPLARRVEAEEFSQTLPYLVHTDPFLRALHAYSEISLDGYYVRQGGEGLAGYAERQALGLAIDVARRTRLDKTGKALEELLFDSIVKEFNKRGQRTLQKFLALLDYFRGLERGGEDMDAYRDHLGQHGLLFRIYQFLDEKLESRGTSVEETAKEILGEFFMPLSESFSTERTEGYQGLVRKLEKAVRETNRGRSGACEEELAG